MSNLFGKKVAGIIQRDPRYKADAYEFLMQALWHTQKKLNRKTHVSGRELLEGARDLALEQFGPMAQTVFTHWGIKITEDFGEIVFNMVEEKLLSKSETDSKDDFKGIYDFKEAFDAKELFKIE